MTRIAASTEIDRSPQDVFDYAIDPDNLADWQENVVRASAVGPIEVGTNVVTTRRLGKQERVMTMQVTALARPDGWSMKGIDGPVRAEVDTRIEPVAGATRSRVTIELDFVGHGIGKVLVPLLVRPEARKGLPRNLELLKARLEGR